MYSAMRSRDSRPRGLGFARDEHRAPSTTVALFVIKLRARSRRPGQLVGRLVLSRSCFVVRTARPLEFILNDSCANTTSAPIAGAAVITAGLCFVVFGSENR